MRTLKIVVAVVLAVAGLGGCGLFDKETGPSEDQRIQQILDQNAAFSVFLASDATDAQRKEVEAALRALPGFTGITFSDHDDAYRKMEEMFSAEPSKMPQIDPTYLPESFEVKMVDIAAVQKIRDDQTAVKALPGVQDLVFPCTTVQECKQRHSPSPAPPAR